MLVDDYKPKESIGGVQMVEEVNIDKEFENMEAEKQKKNEAPAISEAPKEKTKKVKPKTLTIREEVARKVLEYASSLKEEYRIDDIEVKKSVCRAYCILSKKEGA